MEPMEKQLCSVQKLRLLGELSYNTTEEDGSVTGLDGFIVNHRPPTDNGSGFPPILQINTYICDVTTYTKHIELVTYEAGSHEKARGRLPGIIVFSSLLIMLAA